MTQVPIPPPSPDSRPAGVIVIAILLAVLSFAAYKNAFIWRDLGNVSSLPPEFTAYITATQSPLFTALALSYAVTGIIAAAGVFLMKRWMLAAFSIWVIDLLLFGVWLCIYFPIEIFSAGALPVAALRAIFAILTLVSLAPICVAWIYLRRVAATREGSC